MFISKNKIFLIILDAIECMVKPASGAAASKECAGGKKSCVIKAKISKCLHLWKEIPLASKVPELFFFLNGKLIPFFKMLHGTLERKLFALKKRLPASN